MIKKFVTPICAEIDIPSEMTIVTKQSGNSIEFVYCRKSKNERPAWCGDANTSFEMALNYIEFRYDSEPLIIFVEDKTRADKVVQFCKERGFEHFTVDQVERLLRKSKGVLVMLSSQARGVNTQFKRTAKVVIQCEILSYSHFI